MVDYKKHILHNGLTVLIHEDKFTPLAAVNILYKVGARNESPEETGFAHLFEHLMFGGSKNIPVYDEPLQQAGGENNAFTSNDITNYYETLPAENIETALWLESDRMNELAFSESSLEVQRKVVCEEFKENYINQPYGNVWHLLRKLTYRIHPYQWPTIGLELAHIENAKLNQVKEFFFRYYRPNNAILVMGGNLSESKSIALAEKWFGKIERGEAIKDRILAEPVQKEKRVLHREEEVPLNAIYMAWHMPGRLDENYYSADLITDVLSGGKSGRLYQALVKEKKLFSEIHAYQTGSLDPGLIVVEGKLIHGISFDRAEAAIDEELHKLRTDVATDEEITRIKNRIESHKAFSEMELLQKCMNLAYAEMLGNASLVNDEIKYYRAVTTEQIREQANQLLVPSNCSVLYYHARSKAA